MAEFESEVELGITVPESELRSARQTIQDGIGNIEVGLETGTGAASRATAGGTTGGAAGRMQRQTFRWARQRTEDISEATAYLADMADAVTDSGGMMGGAGGGLGGLVGGGGGGLGGMGGFGGIAAGTSASALIQKVSLKSLLKKAPAFATLVTAADLSKDLVTGKLTADDIISAPIELGDQITFGALDNEAVEGAIGTVTLAIGTYQIGSIIAGTLSGSALAGYLGSTTIGSVLTGVGSSASLTGLLTAGGTIAAPVAALIGGTLSLADLVDGDISQWNLPARFGKALGEGVRDEFPNVADMIHQQFTENNPFVEAGKEARKFLDPDYQGQTPEEAARNGEPTGTERQTSADGGRFARDGSTYDPNFTMPELPDNTQGDLAPGQIGRRDGRTVIGQEGGGTEPAVNVQVTDNKQITIERDISDRELLNRLEGMGLSPDTVQDVVNRVDQIQRGSNGGR